MARPHWMAHKFMRSMYEERSLGSKAIRTVKNGGIPQFGVRRKDPSISLSDNNTCTW